MNLSDLPSFKRAVRAAVDADYSVARDAYLECISVCRGERDFPNVGFLLQQLADVEADSGDRDAAKRKHQEAIALDPGSPLPRIFFAQSLIRRLHDPGAAIVELDRAQSLLAASNFPCDGQELPFTYYEREIAKLRIEALNVGPSSEP
jgi:predicted Zn-dependent protease